MNPYEVLEIEKSASDIELERAYNRIIEEYSPKNYENNPLAHLAEEKTQKARKAYNLIKAQRSTNGGEYSGNGQQMMPSGATQDPDKEQSQFMDIRRLINNNMISEADELLEGVPAQRRDAEWYFLKGSVQHSRGWLEDAYENFIRATQMNPQNAEYRAALNQLQWQRQTGRPAGGHAGQSQMQMMECGICNICASMCCANLCCNCMSGC